MKTLKFQTAAGYHVFIYGNGTAVSVIEKDVMNGRSFFLQDESAAVFLSEYEAYTDPDMLIFDYMDAIGEE